MFSFWIQPPFLSAQLTQALQGKNANLHWRSWLCKCQTAEVWTEAEPTSWKTQSSWNCLGIAKAQCSRLKHQGLKEHSSASTVAQQKFPQLHWHRTSWKCPMTVIPNHVSHSTWVWEPGWNNTPTPQTELNPPLEKTLHQVKGKNWNIPWKEMAAFSRDLVPGLQNIQMTWVSVMNLNNTC